MSVGSWLRNRPRLLEPIYKVTVLFFKSLDPFFARVGYNRVDRLIRSSEELTKKIMFDCRMCGQCILHSTGMTCPMTCPKNLRNGPCGGVRENGNCEVFPEKNCVWVEAFERAGKMPTYGHELIQIQPPVNRQLEGTSAWINMLKGEDKQVPVGWSTDPKPSA